MAKSIADMIAMREVTPGLYETLAPPERMGNMAAIAYGGCTIAVTVAAAHRGVPETHHLYSVMGSYLGPALIDRPLRCSVETIRSTRTFETRLVRLSQVQNDGSSRLCMIALADFQAAEKAILMQYSASPVISYSDVDRLQPSELQRKALVGTGKVPLKLAKTYEKNFGLMARFFEQRACPEGILAQNLFGVAKDVVTTQDNIPMTSKTSAEWTRARGDLAGSVQQMAALGFNMDAALSFIPLSHSQRFLEDAGACSSLDFALRVFGNAVDLASWHLKEMKTIVGAEGRTYSEAQIWDERGAMVASMTQQSIMRPKPERSVKL